MHNISELNKQNVPNSTKHHAVLISATCYRIVLNNDKLEIYEQLTIHKVLKYIKIDNLAKIKVNAIRTMCLKY